MRPQAAALGGYYPTPISLLTTIADHLTLGAGTHFSIVDPCAADGDAVFGLAERLFPQPQRTTPKMPIAEWLEACRAARAEGADGPDMDPDDGFKQGEGRLHNLRLYTCELEGTRYEALKHRQKYFSWNTNQHLHGDALRVTWERVAEYGSTPPGSSLLFLNPPYDWDRECSRLEEKFLRRFTQCLADNGALVFLVPHYALSASADTLAREYTDLRCYRFPTPEYEVFKQVVLFAVKRPGLFDPDPVVRAQVMLWAESVEGMPVLGDSSLPPVEVPGFAATAFSSWKTNPLDVRGVLARVKPWCSTDRGGRVQPVAGVVPGDGDILVRKYPLATPPKPAHIAAGIAAGVFNGARVSPDDPAAWMPALLVKGVFDKEFKTVDEKHNKDGEKTGEIQVQQPKLRVTVLDTSRGTYHTLRSSAEVTGSVSPVSMTTGDLLKHYGLGLMRVMLEQCPVLHDPTREEHQIPLPALKRPLFKAQAQAVMACVKLIGGLTASPKQRRGKAAFVLGEIGSGKSQVALAVAEATEARSVLIMCPPHLLDSWRDQIQAVTPWARVTVLGDVADVDRWANDPSLDMSIAILSRETAKLGHAWAGVSGRVCPKCGRGLPVSDNKLRLPPEELAKKRVRCVRRDLIAKNDAAKIAVSLVFTLMTVAPTEPEVGQLLRGAHLRTIRKAAAARGDSTVRWVAVCRSKALRACIAKLVLSIVKSERTAIEQRGAVLLGLLAAIEDHALTSRCVRVLFKRAMSDAENYSLGSSLRCLGRDLMLLLPRVEQARVEVAAIEMTPTETRAAYGATDPWSQWRQRRDTFIDTGNDPESYRTGLSRVEWAKKPRGSALGAVAALAMLTKLGSWGESRACGEPLYQAIPEPRRYPLATYIARRYPKVCDLLILDESHELAGEGSAQAFAGHRLSGLGMPVLALTGSVMNGYAESLFNNQWALDPDFRLEFPKDGRSAFIRRYGYLKQLVEEKDKDGRATVFGSHTDRVERTAKTIGTAPGVLPLFVLRYLLRLAVTIHKADLALDLPPCREIVEYVTPSDELMSRYSYLARTLKNQIKADRFDKEMAGKLFGQMSELPSYLDRATVDTGNTSNGSYEIAYPESAEGRVIASEPGLPADALLPKEQQMVDIVRRELTEGRRCMVFGWHEAVLPRLQRILERELSEPIALLQSKVQAAKRQDWIDKHVVRAGRRVAVMNPACVKTGLNNLIWFCTQVWMENPGCDPITVRQGVGRVDRIGKTLESRIYYLVYEGTIQTLAHKLLMHKVGVSLATDGLDAESALAAAGVGDQDSFDGFSVGRVLFEMMDRGESMERERVTVPAVVPVVAPANQNAIPAPPRRIKPQQLDLFGKVA